MGDPIVLDSLQAEEVPMDGRRRMVPRFVRVLVVFGVLTIFPAVNANAQYLGGLGYGYGGYGNGYPAFGFTGAAFYPRGYGYGYPAAYAAGGGFPLYGYPNLGVGYPGFGYAFGGNPYINGYLLPGQAYPNPLFGVGLSPLGVNSALTERYLLGRGTTTYNRSYSIAPNRVKSTQRMPRP